MTTKIVTTNAPPDHTKVMATINDDDEDRTGLCYNMKKTTRPVS